MFCFCLIIGFSKWLLGSMFSWLCICYLFKYCIVHIKKNLFCKRLLISFQVSLTNAKLCNILITISLWKNSSCAFFVFYLQDTCCIQIGSNCLKYHYHSFSPCFYPNNSFQYLINNISLCVVLYWNSFSLACCFW